VQADHPGRTCASPTAHVHHYHIAAADVVVVVLDHTSVWESPHAHLLRCRAGVIAQLPYVRVCGVRVRGVCVCVCGVCVCGVCV